MPSARKRDGKREKKRDDDAPDRILGDPSTTGRRMRGVYGESLKTYAQAYDPQHPVLCMDEQPVQLVQETRPALPATKDHGQRVDDAYERNGTARLFMCAEPRTGFRQATARTQRTKADWALEVAHLLDTRDADCAKVT